MPDGQIGIPAYPWLEQGMALPGLGGLKVAWWEISPMMSTAPGNNNLADGEFQGPELGPDFDNIGVQIEEKIVSGTPDLTYHYIKLPAGYYLVGYRFICEEEYAAEWNAEFELGCYNADSDSFELGWYVRNTFIMPAGVLEQYMYLPWMFSFYWKAVEDNPGNGFLFYFKDKTGVRHRIGGPRGGLKVSILIIQLKEGWTWE